MVDDGSVKKNSSKYQEVCLKSKKIKYYYKVNGGVSSARNYGVSKSKGEYITFVDSDDIVLKCFLDDNRSSLSSSKNNADYRNIRDFLGMMYRIYSIHHSVFHSC